MKAARTALVAAFCTLILGLCNAFAASGQAEVIDTNMTFRSGILVLAFVGFLALIVVVQTIPAIVTMYTMIKKTAEESKRQQAVRISARD